MSAASTSKASTQAASRKAEEMKREEQKRQASACIAKTRIRDNLEGGRKTICIMEGADLTALRPALIRWPHNRDLDKERALRLAQTEEKLFERTGRYGFSVTPVVVSLFEAQHFLLDGQHRIQAWETLGCPNKTEWEVHVVRCASKAEVDELFLWVNSGTPVPAAYYSELTRDIITEFLNELGRRYPDVPRSGKCQRPRYVREKVLDEISETTKLRDAIIDGKVKADDLLTTAEAINERKRDLYAGSERLRKAEHKCYEMAERLGFFMGLDPDWPTAVASETARKATNEEK